MKRPAHDPFASSRGACSGVRLAAYAGVCLGVVALSKLGLLRRRHTAPLAMGAVAIAMWHGAYDAVQARPMLEPRFGARWRSVFGAGYLLLGGVTLAGWWRLPFPSLVLFLAYAAWHFGTEPEHARLTFPAAVTGLALGALPSLAACKQRPEQVVPIFAAMLRPLGNFGSNGPAERRAVERAIPLVRVLGAACLPVLALAILGIGADAFHQSVAERVKSIAAALLTTALFFGSDPMVAFAVYFCAWHTPEHLVATSEPGLSGLDGTLAQNVRTNLRAGFGPWMASLAGLGCVWLLGRRAAASYQAELFIVLSALTVPHMALNEMRRFALDEPGISALSGVSRA